MEKQFNMSLSANKHGLKIGDRIRDRHYGIGTVRSLIMSEYYTPSPLYYVEYDNVPNFGHFLGDCGGLIPSGLGQCNREDYMDVIEITK
jgi:hypothetical protein